jgi:hypothetical protein
MRARTDDEVYRVDAVWLGPENATMPWRVRYVGWGVGLAVFLLVAAVQRQIGIGFGFFSVAWALVLSIVITRLVCSRISHERPMSAVIAMWVHELRAPRRAPRPRGGAVSPAAVRIRHTRPTRGGRS